jgi:hypothetical protein
LLPMEMIHGVSSACRGAKQQKDCDQLGWFDLDQK